jgi:hypothetical protein
MEGPDAMDWRRVQKDTAREWVMNHRPDGKNTVAYYRQYESSVDEPVSMTDLECVIYGLSYHKSSGRRPKTWVKGHICDHYWDGQCGRHN